MGYLVISYGLSSNGLSSYLDTGFWSTSSRRSRSIQSSTAYLVISQRGYLNIGYLVMGYLAISYGLSSYGLSSYLDIGFWSTSSRRSRSIRSSRPRTALAATANRPRGMHTRQSSSRLYSYGLHSYGLCSYCSTTALTQGHLHSTKLFSSNANTIMLVWWRHRASITRKRLTVQCWHSVGAVLAQFGFF